jgi:hypothetical protein
MKIILFLLVSLLCIFSSHGMADKSNFVEDCSLELPETNWGCDRVGTEEEISLLDIKECAVGIHSDTYLRIGDEEITLGYVSDKDGSWWDAFLMKRTKPRLPRKRSGSPTIFYQGKLINEEGYMTVILERMVNGNVCEDHFGMAIRSNTKVFVLSGTNLWHGCCIR